MAAKVTAHETHVLLKATNSNSMIKTPLTVPGP